MASLPEKNNKDTHITQETVARAPTAKSKIFANENDDIAVALSPPTNRKSFALSCWSSNANDCNPLSPPPHWDTPPFASNLQDDDVSWSTSDDDNASWCSAKEHDGTFHDDNSSNEDDALLKPQVKRFSHPHSLRTSNSWSSSDDDIESSSDTSDSSSDNQDEDALLTPQEDKHFCHPPQRLFYLTANEWNRDADDDEDEESLDEKQFDSLSLRGNEKEFDSAASSTGTRVSFSSDQPQVRIVPRPSLEDMSELFYSCHELQKICDERSLEEEEDEDEEEDRGEMRYYNTNGDIW